MLQDWCRRQLPGVWQQAQWQSLRGDAGQRRYYRLQLSGESGPEASRIAVSAPPESEKNHEFVAMANALEAAGVRCPRPLAVDYPQGFMLLPDLGDRLLLDELRQEGGQRWYDKALEMLLKIQRCFQSPETIPQAMPEAMPELGWRPPPYDDRRLREELELFPRWFVEELLGHSCSDREQALCLGLFNLLIDQALEQPQVCVHRDFHSRNLMVTATGELATLDFQDAVIGPISYDLVSLLRDCYIVWPEAVVRQWLRHYLQQHRQQDGRPGLDEASLWSWFELMGAQRHLKVLGIFARLWLRDGKPGYLADLRTVLHYLAMVLPRHPQLAAFNRWFQGQIMEQASRQDWYRHATLHTPDSLAT